MESKKFNFVNWYIYGDEEVNSPKEVLLQYKFKNAC